MKICHLTVVHPRFDTRIFHRMCKSQSNDGMFVNLIVSDGGGVADEGGVTISDVGKPKYRISRLLKHRSIYLKALEINSDLYHIHDPELILVGLFLKQSGKSVIFDAHEDVVEDIKTKKYIPFFLRGILSAIYARFEKFALPRFNGIITSTDYIRLRYSSFCSDVISVKNYPDPNEISPSHIDIVNRRNFAYIGVLSRNRGISNLVAASSYCKSKCIIDLCGIFSPNAFKKELSTMRGWINIKYHGVVDRYGVNNILSQSVAGLVVLSPQNTFIHSLPVKLFEYMSAGIPVIASDFDLWRDIVQKYNCGILVDPNDLLDISNAMDFLIENPDIARVMGDNGRMAVESTFNWNSEYLKLQDFYKSLLNRP